LLFLRSLKICSPIAQSVERAAVRRGMKGGDDWPKRTQGLITKDESI
jgi:hypothetical protein